MVSFSAVALAGLLVLTADKVPAPPFLANCFLLGGEYATGPCRAMNIDALAEESRRTEELMMRGCFDLQEQRPEWWIRQHRPDCAEVFDDRKVIHMGPTSSSPGSPGDAPSRP